jgi:SH3-like domain-containing protein
MVKAWLARWCAIFMVVIVPSFASAQTLIVNDPTPSDGWLNLRTGPSTSYNVIQRIYNGLWVQEIGRSGNWAQVRLSGGTTGRAYGPYLLPAQSAGGRLIVNDQTDGWLNLRTGPNTSYRIIQRMNNGLYVQEIGRQGNWSEVRLPGGTTGWSYRPFMNRAAPIGQTLRAPPIPQPGYQGDGTGRCARRSVSGWFIPALLCNEETGTDYIRCMDDLQTLLCNF